MLFLLILTLGSCREENRELEEAHRKNDSLTDALEQQKQVSDSLQKLAKNPETENDFPIYFGREFEDMENPEEFISGSLREYPEMIPLDAVLGGTMEFRHIKVLTDSWVLAHYDDGHIAGESIYSYELQEDGTLDFELVASHNQD
ncbi:hypothetical protein GCM10007103_13210 [Salinimicrobium marinum]|uniref:Uncharacterized protein n=1 Tax=Salinimicrobium marinum TaxID=680283 RepID=A0A918SCE6_9FLAO|nr:hypothetical protein [Salinimicrobium marinum]GHA33106.1 hypothetical protein GCM10007103_13210 [Salinimicrobium marinum]